MSSALFTFAEKEAEKAEALQAFSGLKLAHIKRQISEMLSLLGRTGVFDEYTKHDISHINELLKVLDWIIPELTKKKMSAADWLMTVLGIYFHDLGMLVTKAEYAARNESGFPAFKEEVLFLGPDGEDYRAKVTALGPDASERFFYQEFVRHKHAERVRAWITGQAKDQLGITADITTEVNHLLTPLGTLFRRDLGLICESHHLNDLADLKKYKPMQPYGNSDAETANLQYCAVLLRTADLLHITSDRTPSIVFRVINPTDPVSQQEWAKQMAVTRVRPKVGLNSEGIADEKAPRDTIEVHAYFKREDGFFGLTSYLVYVAGQLKKSHEWISGTSKLTTVPHEFPWRKIDDSNIETEGFIRETFEFTIDQAKVLDLLTGHTLYNDTKVVLREMVQNSIDAIRLQFHPVRPTHTGKIRITWDTATRILSVQDNGTGMSQHIINNFLLKVGSSRYQDPEFIKKHPDFSSISRFGIGVLSTFMISDTVEILTCHPDDEQARQITLRSVHGKYLVRLFDKNSPQISHLGDHGTMFKLKVRRSVDMSDVVSIAKHWLVVPDCDVVVEIDGGAPTKVGSGSVRPALTEIMRSHGFIVDDDQTTNEPSIHVSHDLFRVIERHSDGVAVAFAVEWSPYFREWSFVANNSERKGKIHEVLATCIEGIRVESGCPGMKKGGIIALSNATGRDAPKTNVARSGLEATEERDRMLERVYRIYGGHVEDELRAMHEKRDFSLTWAAHEANYLFKKFPSDDDSIISRDVFVRVRSELKINLVEVDDRREVRSAAALATFPVIVTVDCQLLRSAEFLIREIKGDASVSQLVKALGIEEFSSPNDVILCISSWDKLSEIDVLGQREVVSVRIIPEQRRVDLRWGVRESTPRWRRLDDPYGIVGFALERGSARKQGLLVGLTSVVIDSPTDYVAVRCYGEIFVLPGTAIQKAVVSAFDRLAAMAKFEDDLSACGTLVCLCAALNQQQAIKNPREFIIAHLGRLQDTIGDRSGGERLRDLVDVDALCELIRDKPPLFDSSVWARNVSF